LIVTETTTNEVQDDTRQASGYRTSPVISQRRITSTHHAVEKWDFGLKRKMTLLVRWGFLLLTLAVMILAAAKIMDL